MKLRLSRGIGLEHSHNLLLPAHVEWKLFRYSRKYLLLSTDLVLPLPDDVGGGLVSAVHAARQLQRGVVVHVYVGPAHDLRDGLCVDM